MERARTDQTKTGGTPPMRIEAIIEAMYILLKQINHDVEYIKERVDEYDEKRRGIPRFGPVGPVIDQD